MRTTNQSNNRNTPLAVPIGSLNKSSGNNKPKTRKRKAASQRRKKSSNSDTEEEDFNGGRWTKAEDERLRLAVQGIGPRNWKRISKDYMEGSRTDVQCLHRWNKVLRPGLVKGPWTSSEDDIIRVCIAEGITKWSEIANRIPGRIGKQCRERWFNHLDPTIKKGGWTEEEDLVLVEMQRKLGNKWCEIARFLPGRSENAVKNRWNSAMRRKGGASKRNGGTDDRKMTPLAIAASAAAEKKRLQKLKGTNGSDTTTSGKGTPRMRSSSSVPSIGSQRDGGGTTSMGKSPSLKLLPSMVKRPLPCLSPNDDPFSTRKASSAPADAFGGRYGTLTSLGSSAPHLKLVGIDAVNTPHDEVLSNLVRADTDNAILSEEFLNAENERNILFNSSALTEREQMLMKIAFMAGAKQTKSVAHAADNLVWNFSKKQNDAAVSVPSHSSIESEGAEADEDLYFEQLPFKGGLGEPSGDGEASFDLSRVDAMEISWGGSVKGHDIDGNMAIDEMSLSLLSMSLGDDIRPFSRSSRPDSRESLNPRLRKRKCAAGLDSALASLNATSSTGTTDANV